MWVTLALVVGLLFLLIISVGAPHYLFMAGCVILILCDIISMEEFIAGFSNEGMMTIGLMFAIVTPVSKTGILQWFTRRVFIFKRFPVFNLVFLMATCSFLSMWMNNTPIVALFIPIISEWSEKNNLPASKFLIPLSYSTIAGGMCTIIGTSTNLVVNGFLESIHEKEFSFFELGYLGIPMLGILMIWILVVGYWLLPSNKFRFWRNLI
jgi:di/tricarboxylate transporter